MSTAARPAPRAKALVVGYPDGLPQNGSNCYPDVPFSSADATWLHSMESAWVNGLLPTSAAFPLHPKQAGEANMARQVEGAL